MKVSRLPSCALCALAALCLLVACGDNNAQSGPGGLTPEDAEALDLAAEKLDAKALPSPTLPAGPPVNVTKSAMSQPSATREPAKNAAAEKAQR
jgi:hypothetical protein